MRRLIWLCAWLVGACVGDPAVERGPDVAHDHGDPDRDRAAPSSGAAPERGDPGNPVGPTRSPAPAGELAPGVPGAPSSAFQDVTLAAGIDAIHVAALLHTAIGQAWGDFDSDGWLDLYVTGGMTTSRLFLNAGDGTFLSVDPGPAALVAASTGGAAWGDYDNDGYDDLFVVTASENHLFHNADGVLLEDVTEGSGITGSDQSMMVAWGDYDADGWLDLYVANHGLDPDQLYRGRGDGTFTDVTHVLPGSGEYRPAFAATFTDVDHDGLVDLYVVNDHHFGNELYRGGKRGRFQAIGERSGAALHIDGMGLAVGDYDNDLDLDFFMSDIWGSHLLRSARSQGGTGFESVADEALVNFEDAISWGTEFLDFDNDGWLDLYLATQHPESWRSNRLWRNLGDGTFADVSEGSGASDPGWSYGAVVADYDEDGRVDLVVGNRGEGYRLYRNTGTAGPDHHFVTIDLQGAGPVNRNALGARVWVTDSAGVKRFGEVRSGSTMGGGSSMRLHFGLGAATVTRIKVRWPDGTIAHPPIATDALVSYTYGD